MKYIKICLQIYGSENQVEKFSASFALRHKKTFILTLLFVEINHTSKQESYTFCTKLTKNAQIARVSRHINHSDLVLYVNTALKYTPLYPLYSLLVLGSGMLRHRSYPGCLKKSFPHLNENDSGRIYPRNLVYIFLES